jgi:hypothetical protein
MVPLHLVCLQSSLRSRRLRLGLGSAFGRSLLALDTEHQGWQARFGFCRWGSRARRAEQNGGLPGGLPEGLGQVLDHLSGILVEQWVMLHDQEAVVVLLQDGHELEEGVGRRTSSCVKLRFSRLKMREGDGAKVEWAMIY